MQAEGPPLENLTRRLAEMPEDLFAEPFIAASKTGRIHVDAVVADLFRQFSLPFSPVAFTMFGKDTKPNDRNALSVTLVLCWLLADDSLRAHKPDGARLSHLLHVEARELASGGAAKRFVADPERREEISRLALTRLSLRPAGETEAQAQDRFASLNSAERKRLLEASRQAEERARKIREALAKKAADEEADKWTRE
jgi:hypothetical protein